MKPTIKVPSKRKTNEARKAKKEGERKRKVKVKTAVSLVNAKTISKFCFLCMPELHKLIFCIWIIRPQSVRPVNGLMVSFSSLYGTTLIKRPLG